MAGMVDGVLDVAVLLGGFDLRVQVERGSLRLCRCALHWQAANGPGERRRIAATVPRCRLAQAAVLPLVSKERLHGAQALKLAGGEVLTLEKRLQLAAGDLRTAVVLGTGDVLELDDRRRLEEKGHPVRIAGAGLRLGTFHAHGDGTAAAVLQLAARGLGQDTDLLVAEIQLLLLGVGPTNKVEHARLLELAAEALLALLAGVKVARAVTPLGLRAVLIVRALLHGLDLLAIAGHIDPLQL
mmetsp:Transcript_30380/g.82252  ORF Transcript_30380/g.82252 Transcript_30380/m.82252 type:complete len:241 (+) Transcript_30380:570-1292(+)